MESAKGKYKTGLKGSLRRGYESFKADFFLTHIPCGGQICPHPRAGNSVMAEMVESPL